MNKILIVILAAVAALSVDSQVIDDIYGDTIATSRQQQDDSSINEEYIDSVDHNLAVMALKAGYWVLQAESVSLGNVGYTYNGLNESTNFIYQQGDQALVQVAISNTDPGFNGLGGVTMDGRALKPRMEQSDKGEVYYTFTVSGADINADVDVTLFAKSNEARATVTPVFGNSPITYYGRVVPYRR